MDYYKLIYKQLSRLDYKYSDKKVINPTVFIADVIKNINMLRLPSKVLAKKYKISIKNGQMEGVTSGYYSAELDDENKPCVFLCFGILDRKNIECDWILTKEEICNILEHEFCHLRQFRDRDYDDFSKAYIEDDGFLEYLSDVDEMEAYAINVARHLLRSCGTYREALKALKDKTKHTNDYSPYLKIYTNAFAKYPKVLKIFYRWCHIYLKRIEEGRI